MKKKVVIILPTYNERGNITSLIEEIFRTTTSLPIWQTEILVVDSGSPDQTARAVIALKERYPGRLHLLKTAREGLGKAYYQGFKYALEKLHPYLFFSMDADWSHLPEYIPVFLKKIEAGADFVIGSRYIKGGSIPKSWGIDRKIFSFFGNQIVRWGFMKPKITDWTGGFRTFKAYIAKENLNYIKNRTGYIFQVAFLDKALKDGARIDSVPINFKNRRQGVSKIDPMKYSSQVFLYVFTHSSFIKFVIVGLGGFIIDFGLSYLIISILKIKPSLYWLATLISAETAIIFNFNLHNLWSFAHKKIKGHWTKYLHQFIKFNLIASGSIIIQATGIQILTNILGAQNWIFYKIFIIAFIIIPYSYLLYNKIIWKEKR
ncbi:MAG: glycosyltransferase [FCB group bacterium]|nr:glycosyltransferase [FCB group bacterium]